MFSVVKWTVAHTRDALITVNLKVYDVNTIFFLEYSLRDPPKIDF